MTKTSPLFIPNPLREHNTICIMCPGPSLTQEQADMIRDSNHFTIVVGDAHLYYEQANILYHADKRWWEEYNYVPEFEGQFKIAMEDMPDKGVYKLLRASLWRGLSHDPPYVVTAGCSGYQAINLACFYKPSKIILVGYDCKRDPLGKYNIRGDHPKSIRPRQKNNLEKFVDRFNFLVEPLRKENVQIYNCTIDTAISAFERKELKDAL